MIIFTCPRFGNVSGNVSGTVSSWLSADFADFWEKYPDADGVFVSGYTLSQVFYEAALERGKKIPDDLQIISYDGIFKQWGIYHMTSVEQPIEEMARQVVRLLVKEIRGEKTCTRTVFKTKFVLGKTTK